MARALKALIDGAALQHNLNRVKACAPHCLIMAMLKANGYGHGIVNVAKALHGADAYGVACIEEAVQLVEAGITKPVVLMEGFFEPNELPQISAMNVQVVIHHAHHVRALRLFHGPITVWIKINTGMHRLGFPGDALESVLETLYTLPHIKIAGILTHFARADEWDSPETVLQTERFIQALIPIHQVMGISLANSAGILAWPDCVNLKRLNALYVPWVRPGLMLYGASPFAGRIGQEEGLKPAMTLVSKLIAIQKVSKGGAVGYGGIFIAKQDMQIGVIAVGYGDGYPRLMPTGTPVLLKGVRVPLVGRVSMDMLTVDLSLVPDAEVGDPVQLWGPELPVEEVASSLGTTAYELLTGLSSRVPVEWV
jgi:alanine racemase